MGNKRDELIEKYAGHLVSKFDVQPDMDLLKKVTVGLGPSIYNRDSANVSSTDSRELERVKTNFLLGKLGLKDGPELMDALHGIMSKYGASQRTKYRAVVYYLLVRHFRKEAIYDQ